MDTKPLQLFVSAADTLSYSRTAEQFSLSESFVSEQIGVLESSLGVKLFNKPGRNVTLTAEGHEFLPYAELALDTLINAKLSLQNMPQSSAGHIKIAALSSMADQLGVCIKSLNSRYPAILVDIDLLEGTALVDSIPGGEYDFYFATSGMLSSATYYEFTPICNDRLELYVNKNIADKIDVSDWTTIKDYPFVSASKADAWLSGKIIRICKNRGFTPNIINYFSRAATAIISVNAGIGIAILPRDLKKCYMQPNVVTIEIPGDDVETEVAFAWKQVQNSTASILFKEVAIHALASEYDCFDRKKVSG